MSKVDKIVNTTKLERRIKEAEDHIKALGEKINDLEKRLEEAEDQWWMNYDSDVPSEELTIEEILESLKELRERKNEH